MALIKCSECGKDISDKAATCPHCGCPLLNAEYSQKHKKKNGVDAKRTKIFLSAAFIVGVIIVFAILILTHTICLKHSYSDASVLKPQTCYHCGKTQGQPKSLMKIQFPMQGVGSLLPMPSSNMGEIKWDDDNSFSAYVGNMTEYDFDLYVQMCAENGFDIDYQKGEDYYYADDVNGNNLNIWYKGNNIIEIQIVATYEDEIDAVRTSENETESASNKEPESSPSTSPNETTEKESINLAEARIIFENVFEEYNTLIDDFSGLLDYCNENTFTSIEEIDEYENQWIALSNDAYQLANMLLVKIPPKEVEVEWAGFAERLMKIGSILFMNATLDANLDGYYDAAEMEEVIIGARDEFVVVSEEIVNIAEKFNSITQGEAITITDNTTSTNSKKCEECGKTATKAVNLFGQTEYYCITHYNEIMDIIDMMESDVGQGSASKHTCEECSNEGTHSIIGFSGKTEYYCTKHYNELKEMLDIFG